MRPVRRCISIGIAMYLMYSVPILKGEIWDSGCASVGRVVASDSRGLRFKSSHCATFSDNSIENTKINKKESVNDPFKQGGICAALAGLKQWPRTVSLKQLSRYVCNNGTFCSVCLSSLSENASVLLQNEWIRR